MIGDSDSNGNIIPTSDASRTLGLRDSSKRPIILLAPSASECTLWARKIREARKQFAKNEKNLLQRQRSRKFVTKNNFLRLNVFKIIIIICNYLMSRIVR